MFTEFRKLAMVTVGCGLSFAACLHIFSWPETPPRDTPQATRLYTFDAYYSFYATPGAHVDVVCVPPREQESGEKLEWVLELLKNVRVVAVGAADSKPQSGEWSAVTVELTV